MSQTVLVFGFISLLILQGVAALLLWRRLRARRVLILLLAGWSLSILAALALLPPRPQSADQASVHVILMWTDRQLLAELAQRYSDRDVVLLAHPQAEQLCRTAWPKARYRPFPHTSGDEGIVVEQAFAYLHSRAGELRSAGEIVLVAPRARELAAARQASADLAREHPLLHDRVRIVLPEELGRPWPALAATAPLTITPDQKEFAYRVAVEGSPEGATLRLELHGRDKGALAGAELKSRAIGERDNQLAVDGSRITLTKEEFRSSGLLPAPEDNRTTVVSARLHNGYETIAFARTTTTARIQPIGVLTPVGRPTSEPLRQLLVNTGLDQQAVALGTDLEKNKATFRRWKLLVVDGKLEAEEAERLREVLETLPAPPTLLFTGVDSAATIKKDGKMLLGAPLSHSKARQVAILSDISGSFNVSVRDRNNQAISGFPTRCCDLALGIARQLNPGLDYRNTTRVIVAHKNWQRVELDQYVGTEAERSSGQFELAHHLKYMRAEVDRDPTLSDVISFFDPADVDGDSRLAEEYRKCARELLGRGVRLHLVAMGRIADDSGPGDLGPEVFNSVIGTVNWVKDIDGKRLPVRNEAEMTQLVVRYLLQQGLPRLPIQAPQVKDLLAVMRARGAEDLANFVKTREGQLQRINALTSFRSRDPKAPNGWPVALSARTALWLGHWVDGQNSAAPVAPLLVRDEIALGAGKAPAPAWQLMLDLQAENAAGVDAKMPQTQALAGLLVRMLAGIAGQWVDDAIYFAPTGDGFSFYRQDYQPFRILAKATQTTEGAGLGLFRDRQGRWERLDQRLDVRRLDMPWVAPRGLSADKAELVRVVVEHTESPTLTDRLVLDLPLKAAPPQPVRSRSDLEVPQPTSLEREEVAVSRWDLPAPVLAGVIAATWILFAWYCRRGL